jgi:ketosteroid isomerase-like protein
MSVGDDRERIAVSAFQAWNRRDTDGWQAAFHPDCEVHAPLGMAEEPYRGHEGLRRWSRDIQESFGHFDIAWEDLKSTPECVIALGRIHVTGRESGVEFAQPVGYVAEFDGPTVKRLRVFFAHDEALEAARASR